MTRGAKGTDSTPAPRPMLRPTGAFLMRFALVWLGALALFALVPEIERWMVRATIACVRGVGALAGIPSQVQGDLVLFKGARPAEVASDCTTLLPTTLLWAGILAYPAQIRWKLIGMAAGAAILWGYNLVRILSTIAILGWHPFFVSLFHVYVWQTLTIVFACALFWYWLGRAAPDARRT